MPVKGPRCELARDDARFPAALARIPDPPKRLYVVGDTAALQEGLAVVGARKATPYGIGCATRFAQAAAERGVVIISGGARGCDAAAHRAALEAGAPTVVFLGGGCDELYPAEHESLFQRIVDGGGALVSEHPWDRTPRPYMFRARNRLIAGLARAVLIVEAGLPSGTFSTADEALAAGRDVLVVPGAITSPSSRGANRLLHQGAVPIVDDETFADALFSLFGCLKQESWEAPAVDASNSAGEEVVESARVSVGNSPPPTPAPATRSTHASRNAAEVLGPLAAALVAEPLGMEELFGIARDVCIIADPRVWLMEHLVEAERAGLVTHYPDGRWGPVG
ncbi:MULTISPECIES: DNA-processing protein DprA [Gordonibacter]|uniref:DNA-processing protein DprA n=1 Tax=Gordonibacter faecis TaxID=3047475 RepID=A0ABT7DPV4_9ACTN|nr:MULTISPECIES: DNA-processing protein DprA [unclassified Gordonibacter]MDJ1651580.1 DNA-processing protein DprA [Gordonibacter sp. KGMB12511]HIW77002.1 DNA-processing protein DprA [Candidatus Gordonibacter avicola]